MSATGYSVSKKFQKIFPTTVIIRIINIFPENEPNLISLQDPLTVVGDIHG